MKRMKYCDDADLSSHFQTESERGGLFCRHLRHIAYPLLDDFVVCENVLRSQSKSGSQFGSSGKWDVNGEGRGAANSTDER